MAQWRIITEPQVIGYVQVVCTTTGEVGRVAVLFHPDATTTLGTVRMRAEDGSYLTVDEYPQFISYQGDHLQEP